MCCVGGESDMPWYNISWASQNVCGQLYRVVDRVLSREKWGSSIAYYVILVAKVL